MRRRELAIDRMNPHGAFQIADMIAGNSLGDKARRNLPGGVEGDWLGAGRDHFKRAT